MAILQISQITQRKGLQIDLPQLAGAELGWSIDERRLWIGNGTLAEGAPVVGNTEILTEFSNIASVQYTYSGISAAGYAAAGAVPVSYQDWLDQYASVLDFGIIGDGVTDVTVALNAALYQMYCVDPTNTQARRALFFPAGTYVVSGTINIPSNAMLFGDGIENTIIQYTGGASGTFAAQTAGSAQQTGVANAGSTGITISNMGFSNTGSGGAFLVENATNTTFNNVSFTGGSLASDPLVGFSIPNGLTIKQVVFNECDFTNALSAVNTDAAVSGVVFSNSYFYNLQQGILLGAGITGGAGPTAVRITNNLFDAITAEGIIVGNSGSSTPGPARLIATSHNVFLNVGNNLNPAFPTTPVITFNTDNNISVGDMFNRTDALALIQPRISMVGSQNINTQNGAGLSLGSYTRSSGLTTQLFDGASATLFTQDVTNSNAISFNYTILRNIGGTTVVRTGTFRIASNSLGAVSSSDDYDETTVSGVTFTATRALNTLTVTYSTTLTGAPPAPMYYSINYFN